MLPNNNEMENEACVGGLCFLQLHFGYFPPHFYQWIYGRVGVLFFLSPLSLLLLLLLLRFAFVKLDYVFLFVLHSVFLSFYQLNWVFVFLWAERVEIWWKIKPLHEWMMTHSEERKKRKFALNKLTNLSLCVFFFWIWNKFTSGRHEQDWGLVQRYKWIFNEQLHLQIALD
jgi:hypothetical protein